MVRPCKGVPPVDYEDEVYVVVEKTTRWHS